MKKKIPSVILILLCVFGGVYSQEIIINKQYRDYEYKFQKLNEGEVLSYRWAEISHNGKEYTFTLFAQGPKSTRIIGYWDIGWAQYQFSEDKKTAIFFLKGNGANRPLCFIDGHTGTINYVMDVNLSAMTDSSLRYLAVAIYRDSNIASGTEFGLIDIHNVKYLKTINWNVKKPQLYAWLSIRRSADKTYDFIIDYKGEHGYLIASCYYKIGSDEVVTIFDYSDLSYEKWLKP